MSDVDLGLRRCWRELFVFFDGLKCLFGSVFVAVVRPSISRVRLIPSMMEVRAVSIRCLCAFFRSISSGGGGLVLSFVRRSWRLCCFVVAVLTVVSSFVMAFFALL